jgi:GT2 family glycosyltransferase/glycosyltransferase involved in cell wall biosynthesis
MQSETESGIQGRVDHSIGLTIVGWALDPQAPEQAIHVEAWVDDQLEASGLADEPRSDLLDIGVRDNVYHGFRLTLPLRFASGDPVTVEIRARSVARESVVATIEVLDTSASLSPWLDRLAKRLDESSDNHGAAATIRALSGFVRHHEDRFPRSMPFSGYRDWRQFFFPANPDGQASSNAALALEIIIDARDGDEGLAATRASVEQQSVAPIAVQVLRDNGAQRQRLIAQISGKPGYVLFIRAGATLHEGALSRLAPFLSDGTFDVLYTDHDCQGTGETSPIFKPAWNYDLFLAQDYLAPLCLIQCTALLFANEDDDLDDLLFRAIERAGPDRIGHYPVPLATVTDDNSGTKAKNRLTRRLPAINRHLERVSPGSMAEMSDEQHGLVSVHWRQVSLPRTAFIIPSKDKVELLTQCIDSLKQALGNVEAEICIIDNGSIEDATFAYYETLKGDPSIRVIPYPHPFNYAEINNFAVGQVDAEVVALVNNDVTFPDSLPDDWMAQIIALLDRSDVGAVGIKLLYPGGRIQHGGVILGNETGIAGHAFRHLTDGNPGYEARAISVQQFSAVTAASLFMRRNAYKAIGGMDGKRFQVAFNDVDLCLRLGKKGLRVIWTPHVWAFHHESASRGAETSRKGQTRLQSEIDAMRAEWNDALVGDPAYSPNLGLDGLAFSGLAFPPRGFVGGQPVPRFSRGKSLSLPYPHTVPGLGEPIDWYEDAAVEQALGNDSVDLMRSIKVGEGRPGAQGFVSFLVMRPGERLFQRAPAFEEVTDFWSAVRYCINLIRGRRDIRQGFPDAISAGLQGEFGVWITSDKGRQDLGLSEAAIAFIREALAARPGDRVRQLYFLRDDLQEHFPLALTPEGLNSFVRWLMRYGRSELRIREEEVWWLVLEAAEKPEREFVWTFLFSPRWQTLMPDGLTQFGRYSLSKWIYGQFDATGDWLDAEQWPIDMTPAQQIQLRYSRDINWQRTYPAALYDEASAARLLKWLGSSAAELPKQVRGWVGELDIQAVARQVALGGVNVIGHFCYVSGLQISVESVCKGLSLCDTAIMRRNVVAHGVGEIPRHFEFTGLEIYDTTIIHMQPDISLADILQRAGLSTTRFAPHRIAYWYWELEDVPPHWATRATEFDEVWVATDFIADAMRKRCDTPVKKLTPGVELPDFETLPRSHFGLPDGKFVFAFVFHMTSVTERKNPLGLINAFRKAFGRDDDAVLLIKASFGELHPDTLEELQAATDGTAIRIVNDIWSRDETLSLIHNCDCYVSLHRSEGFGLTMAEAMLMEKPVIATGYSGNLEFMNGTNSLLVDYDLVPVGPGHYPYPEDSVWAEPSQDHAAKLMRHVYENRSSAAALGAKARLDILDQLDVGKRGKEMAARLTEIRTRRYGRGQ